MANRKTTPQDYRDYGKCRHKLLVRILSRMERTCRATGRDFHGTFHAFMAPWFNISSSSSSSSHADQDDSSCNKKKARLEEEVGEESGGDTDGLVPPESLDSTKNNDNTGKSTTPASTPSFTPRKEDAAELLSWAFFCKHAHELEHWEKEELQSMFDILQKNYSIEFRPGRTSGVTPKRLNLDTLQPLPRPLLVYGLIALLQFASAAVLRWFGFRYYRSDSGLTYWYRPALPPPKRNSKKDATNNDDNDNNNTSLLQQSHQINNDGNHPNEDDNPPPLLFFHGIAPAGLTFYVPMVLRCLCRIYDNTDMSKKQRQGRRRRQAIFLFENRPISYNLCRNPVNEEETVKSVLDAVDHHMGKHQHQQHQQQKHGNSPPQKLALCGHSFGSCQLTWLLRAAPDRVHQLILLDPVTILLSEPDVMVNFLYKKQKDAFATVNSAKIYLLASTELYTEHYLRRHFSWYNSELWLEDIPNHVKVLICLSGKDEIINVDKVLREVNVFCEERRRLMVGMTSSSSLSSSSSSSSSLSSSSKGENNNSSNNNMVTGAGVEGAGGGNGGSNISVIHWPTDGHAACVTSSKHWAQLRHAIRCA